MALTFENLQQMPCICFLQWSRIVPHAEIPGRSVQSAIIASSKHCKGAQVEEIRRKKLPNACRGPLDLIDSLLFVLVVLSELLLR